MFINFSEEAILLLKESERESKSLNHPYVGSEHLFLAILKSDSYKKYFENYGLTYKKFRSKLISVVGIGKEKSKFILYTPLLKRVLENSVIESREENMKYVMPYNIILSILDEEDGVAFSVLKIFNINVDKLYYDIRKNKSGKQNKKKRLLLEEIGVDLTKKAQKKELDPVIGRDNELNKTIEILLRRKKNNPILVGPAGVGKTAIVEALCTLIVNNKCPDLLKNKRIISLNIYSLVSGTKYRGEFEEKMNNIIKELEQNDDIILFIDEVHTIVGAGGAEGAIDASNIFKPALARGKIKIIGATTTDEYKKYIEPDEALSRRFQNVYIKETDKITTKKILLGIKPLYEKYHNVVLPNELIDYIIELSNRYLVNRYEPDKSIDILDEVCALCNMDKTYTDKRRIKLEKEISKIKNSKKEYLKKSDFNNAKILRKKEQQIEQQLIKIKKELKKVSKSDVFKVVLSKANLKSRVDNLKNYYEILKENINKKVLGQEQVIENIINILRKNEISKVKKVFAITIVGTEKSCKEKLAKEVLNQISEKIITLDLSEYSDASKISKLLGTTAGYVGYDNKNNVFETIRTNPASGIIVYNLNKACDEVQKLFKKIVKEGKIEDNAGKIINFANTKIIFIETKQPKKEIGFNKDSKSSTDNIEKITENTFEVNNIEEGIIEKLLLNKMNELVKDYNEIKIEYEKEFIKNAVDNLKEKEFLEIEDYVYNNIEKKIIDFISKDKEKIIFPVEKIKTSI